MNQLTIDYPTGSPINIDRIKGQNRRLYEHLASGKTICCFSEAIRTERIGVLHSRISDLRNKFKAVIYDRMIEVIRYGEKVHCKEYSLAPFDEKTASDGR